MLLIAFPWIILMVSLCGQNKIFVSPLTNPERKICNIVVSEHPEMI